MNVLFLLTTAEREQVGRPTILNPRNSTPPETIASTRCATLYLLTYNIPIKFSIVPYTRAYTRTHTPVLVPREIFQEKSIIFSSSDPKNG